MAKYNTVNCTKDLPFMVIDRYDLERGCYAQGELTAGENGYNVRLLGGPGYKGDGVQSFDMHIYGRKSEKLFRSYYERSLTEINHLIPHIKTLIKRETNRARYRR